jgi:iron(III) transport system permease protein
MFVATAAGLVLITYNTSVVAEKDAPRKWTDLADPRWKGKVSIGHTAWILILAFTTRFLPIAYASSDSALRSIDPELEDAVRILGGGRLLALRRVVAPLLSRGLAGAFILVFIPATRELSAAIFLYTTGTQVLSVLLFDKSDEGNFERLSSIGLVLVVITVALVMAGFRVVGRDFMLRRTSA